MLPTRISIVPVVPTKPTPLPKTSEPTSNTYTPSDAEIFGSPETPLTETPSTTTTINFGGKRFGRRDVLAQQAMLQSYSQQKKEIRTENKPVLPMPLVLSQGKPKAAESSSALGAAFGRLKEFLASPPAARSDLPIVVSDAVPKSPGIRSTLSSPRPSLPTTHSDLPLVVSGTVPISPGVGSTLSPQQQMEAILLKEVPTLPKVICSLIAEYTLSLMGETFKKSSGKWGYRSDPEFFKMMQEKLNTLAMPKNRAEYVKILYGIFKELTQVELDKTKSESISFSGLKSKGMSGGSISVKYWTNLFKELADKNYGPLDSSVVGSSVDKDTLLILE